MVDIAETKVENSFTGSMVNKSKLAAIQQQRLYKERAKK